MGVFKQHRQDGEDAPQLKLLREYALRISSWRCFRFVERLLAEYTFPNFKRYLASGFTFTNALSGVRGITAEGNIKHTSAVHSYLQSSIDSSMTGWSVHFSRLSRKNMRTSF